MYIDLNLTQIGRNYEINDFPLITQKDAIQQFCSVWSKVKNAQWWTGTDSNKLPVKG